MADLGFRKGGFQCALDFYTWRSVIMKAREARLLGGSGACPPGKFLISDFLRSFLVSFWGKIARVGRPTANLVVVFEAFKRSQNLKAWLRFARIFFFLDEVRELSRQNDGKSMTGLYPFW